MEQGALVLLEDGQPVGEVLRMVGPRRIGDRQFGAEECSAKFGDEFFEGVSLVAKAFAELPVETAPFGFDGGARACRTAVNRGGGPALIDGGKAAVV
jgi:hypothetical protein